MCGMALERVMVGKERLEPELDVEHIDWLVLLRDAFHSFKGM